MYEWLCISYNNNNNNNNNTNNNHFTELCPGLPGEPVPEETPTHPPSWSSSDLYQLLQSTTIHSILPVQITCLAIFLHNLSTSSLVYLLVWSPPPHIPYISSPNQCLLFATHAHTIATCFAVASRLYNLFLVFLNSLLGTLSFTLTLHIHLTILISARWSATSFSLLTGQVSLPCSIPLRTQLLYSLPLLINDISLLISNGTNCLNLFHPIGFWPPQLHQHLHPHSTYHLGSRTYPLPPDLHLHQYPPLYDCTGYRIAATSTNKWPHHFVHASFYTNTLLVYPLVTTSTLYWITTNTSATYTTIQHSKQVNDYDMILIMIMLTMVLSPRHSHWQFTQVHASDCQPSDKVDQLKL